MQDLFDEYLNKKKIDATLFKTSEPELYNRFALAFEQMHEDSFTLQKLYFINAIRRKYPRKL
jgi:hypothetical protein